MVNIKHELEKRASRNKLQKTIAYSIVYGGLSIGVPIAVGIVIAIAVVVLGLIFK